MTHVEKAMMILEEEYDSFIIIGSIYSVDEGRTEKDVNSHGNAFAVHAMLRDEIIAWDKANCDEGEHEFDG